jgi:uncharacterized membrane protein
MSQTIKQQQQTSISPDVALQIIAMPPLCRSEFPLVNGSIQKTSNQYPSSSSWYPSTSTLSPTIISSSRYITSLTDNDFKFQSQLGGNVSTFILALLGSDPNNWINAPFSTLSEVISTFPITQKAFAYDTNGQALTTANHRNESGNTGGLFDAYIYTGENTSTVTSVPCTDPAFDYGTSLLFTLTNIYNPNYTFGPTTNYYQTSIARNPKVGNDQKIFNSYYPVKTLVWQYYNLDWGINLPGTTLTSQNHTSIGKVGLRIADQLGMSPTVINSYVPLDFSKYNIQINTISGNSVDAGNYWLFFSPYYPGLIMVGNVTAIADPGYQQYSPLNILNSTVASPAVNSGLQVIDAGNGYRCLYWLSPISTAIGKFIDNNNGYDASVNNYIKINPGMNKLSIFLSDIKDSSGNAIVKSALNSISGSVMPGLSVLHGIYTFIYLTRCRVFGGGTKWNVLNGYILCKYTIPANFTTAPVLSGLTVHEPIAQSSFYVGLSISELNALFVKSTPNGFIENVSFVTVKNTLVTTIDTSTSTLALVPIIGLNKTVFNQYISGLTSTQKTSSKMIYIIIAVIAIIIIVIIIFFVFQNNRHKHFRQMEEHRRWEQQEHRRWEQQEHTHIE